MAGVFEEPPCQSGVWIAPGLGYGQTWQDFTASRFNGSTYSNGTSKPIEVSVSVVNANTISALWCFVGATYTAMTGDLNGRRAGASFIVPPGQTYTCAWNGSNSLFFWSELR